jgi:uncharacterized protein with FMN-binding domain
VAHEKKRGANQRVANGLVALSSTAILAVYAAGYVRTRPAAERFTAESSARHAETPLPSPAPTSSATTAVAPAAPSPAPPGRALTPTVASTSTTKPLPNQPAHLSSSTTPEPAETSATRSPDAPAVSEIAPSTVPATEVAAETAPKPAVTQQAQYKDGAYLGWGSCRHGDIQASVVIESGRIASATIAQCRTRYSCTWIEALPGEVVSRQSVKVDYVSGATESTDAFADAVADALARAK